MQTITARIALLLALAAPASSLAEAPPEEEPEEELKERLFVTDLDLGYVWFLSPELAGGFMVRTALDYRPDDDSIGYLRLNLDATSSTIEVAPTDTRQGFSSPLSFNDLVFGGGVRFGDGVVRTAVTAQAGVAIYGLPELTGTDVLTIETSTRVAGAARLQAALELYIGEDLDSALTLELLGQRYFGRPEWAGRDGWSGGLLIGISSEL